MLFKEKYFAKIWAASIEKCGNLVSLNVRPDPFNQATFHQWSCPKTANEENTKLTNHAYIIRTAVDIVGCLCPKAPMVL